MGVHFSDGFRGEAVFDPGMHLGPGTLAASMTQADAASAALPPEPLERWFHLLGPLTCGRCKVRAN